MKSTTECSSPTSSSSYESIQFMHRPRCSTHRQASEHAGGCFTKAEEEQQHGLPIPLLHCSPHRWHSTTSPATSAPAATPPDSTCLPLDPQQSPHSCSLTALAPITRCSIPTAQY
jgi:hypothetical protein